MITKQITFFGKLAIVGCDAKCEKAWGINRRPRIRRSDDGSCEYFADDELGVAPKNPGTYEGDEAKPTREEDRLNKWCVRECERCAINKCGTEPVPENLKLLDWSNRAGLIQ